MMMTMSVRCDTQVPSKTSSDWALANLDWALRIESSMRLNWTAKSATSAGPPTGTRTSRSPAAACRAVSRTSVIGPAMRLLKYTARARISSSVSPPKHRLRSADWRALCSTVSVAMPATANQLVPGIGVKPNTRSMPSDVVERPVPCRWRSSSLTPGTSLRFLPTNCSALRERATSTPALSKIEMMVDSGNFSAPGITRNLARSIGIWIDPVMLPARSNVGWASTATIRLVTGPR